MQFTTDRLFFREYREADFEQYYALLSHPQVMRYSLYERFATRESLRPVFDQMLHNNRAGQERKAYEFAVFQQSDSAYAGFADIVIDQRNDHGGVAEIGYYLSPDCWGKGYATEIALALCDACFDKLGLHKVWARCNANNTASARVMEKCGMRREALNRQVRFKDGRWDDELSYGILHAEWQQLHTT